MLGEFKSMLRGIWAPYFIVPDNPVMPPGQAQGKRRGKLFLLLMALIFLSPIVLSILTYNFWRPQSRINHGELLEVKPVPAMAMTDSHGHARSIAELQGKWLLLTVDQGACEESCQRKLYVMRQVIVAQGREQDRLERILILDNGNFNRDLVNKDPALLVFKVAQTPLLPAEGATYPYIYLVDPRGNLVLRYSPAADPRKIVKDLTRLLKVSQIG